MKVAIQEEATGCGIAAVANILGKTYPEMKKIANSMGIYATDESLWSDTRYVRHLLGAFGASTSSLEHPFISWDHLPDLALLPIHHSQDDGKNFWHWVVFKRQFDTAFVLDSASHRTEHCRTDFEAMSPQWFIEVEL